MPETLYIVSINSLKKSNESKSSTPSRHLTLIGSLVAYFIFLRHSATSFSSFIKHAPSLPHYTFGDGHPQFNLTPS